MRKVKNCRLLKKNKDKKQGFSNILERIGGVNNSCYRDLYNARTPFQATRLFLVNLEKILNRNREKVI